MDDELEEIMKQVAPAAPPLKRVCCLKSFKTLDGQSRAEYDNYANLMEVTATLLLPSGRVEKLRVLLDLGATSNFLSKKLVHEHHIPLSSTKVEKINIGDGGEAEGLGETKPITMKLGSTYRHTSAYTVMELGEYDAVLGMAWHKFAKCQVQCGEELPKVSVVYKRGRLVLPLRTDNRDTDVCCYHLSKKEFDRETNGATEVYQIHYKGWVSETGPEQEPVTPTLKKPVKAPEQALGDLQFNTLKSGAASSKRGPPEATEIHQIPREEDNPELEELLRKFASVFPVDLPKNDLVDREISLRIPLKPGTEPPCQAPYRASHEGQKAIEETLKYLYEHGFARESLSEFGAPVTLAKKSDGTWRFCVDYRKVNAITKEAKFPLPRIEDCLDKLGKANFFSKFDLRSGYWQVKVHPDDIEKTAFRTQNGHHEFLVVPFGLQGAPSTFQRLMNHYLRPYLGKFCLVYLDDILVYSNTREEHLKHLQLILEILLEKRLYAKATKCDLFRTKIAFLGYIIENHTVMTDPAKIEAIKTWPEPQNVREVRSFLGLANFYRKFIDSHSAIAKPLSDLLKSTEFKEKFGHQFGKLAKLKFRETETKAFNALKEALISAPCLVIYDPDKPTELWADASYDAKCVGAVLMQDHGNGYQPVAFLSKVLNTAQSHYPTFEQELLALKMGMEQWRHYLLPISFVARTDHNGLKYLKTQPHLSERQWHWLAFFSEYQFEIQYRPGAKMQVPDALSRRRHDDDTPSLRINEKEEDHKLEIIVGPEHTKVLLNLEKPNPLKMEKLQTPNKFDYSKDKDFSRIHQDLKADPTTADKNPAYRLFSIKDNLLFWIDQSGKDRIIVPCGQRIPLIKETHDTALGGHLGSDKVYHNLKRDFYWPGMRDLINRYVSTCDICQKSKSWNQRPYGLPQLTDVPLNNWDVVSMDFCGPLPKTKRGNDSICVFSDRLSRMTHLAPCSTHITAKGTAELYVKTVFQHHGLSQRVLSDRGPQFIANFWKELWRLLDTAVSLSAPYHPTSNAMTERFNRTHEEALRSFVNSLQDDWDEYLPLFEFAYNDSHNPSTGATPFFLNHGRHPRRPTTVSLVSNVPAAEDFVLQMQNHISSARDKILKSIADNADIQTSNFQDHNLKVNDWVLLKAENYDLLLPSKKLSPRWLGPFQINQVRGPNTMKLDLPKRLERVEPIQNVSWLRKYKFRPAELGPATTRQAPEIVEGEEESEVEAVLADRYSGNRKQYLVRFATYGPEDDLWLPLRNLKHSQEAITEYWARQNDRRLR